MNGLFGNVSYERINGRKIPTKVGTTKTLEFGKYEAFLWLLTCTDEQFDNFMHDQRNSLDCFLWAYNYLLNNICKEY
jgi:hypothetical protein